MDFGEILTKAWQTIWKHKILWIFGILAGCSTSSASLSNSFSSDVEMPSTVDPTFQLPPEIERYITSIPDEQWVIFAIGAGIIAILIGLLMAALSSLGITGVVKGTVMAEAAPQRMSFGEVLSAAMPVFPRVFGLSLLFAILLVVILGGSIVAVVFGTIATAGIALLCLLPLLCLLVPVFFLIGVFLNLSYVAIAVDNVSIGEGVSRAWAVIKNNFWNFVLLALILNIGIGLIGGFIVNIPLALASLPLIGLLFASSAQATNTTLITTGLLLLCALPVSLLLNGILTSYLQSAWTLAYERLTNRRRIEPAPVQVYPVPPVS
jgi:hypothetical protein